MRPERGRRARSATALGLLLLLAHGGAGVASAAVRLASGPHFLALGGRQQIVFFVGDAPRGALVSPLGDGVAVVVVPGTEVAPEIAGQRFLGEGGGDDGPLRVAVESDKSGNARVLVRGAPRGARIRAFALEKPGRLVIEVGDASGPEPASAAPQSGKAKPGVRGAPGKPGKGVDLLSPEAAALVAQVAARAGAEKPAPQTDAAKKPIGGAASPSAPGQPSAPSAKAANVKTSAVAPAVDAPATPNSSADLPAPAPSPAAAAATQAAGAAKEALPGEKVAAASPGPEPVPAKAPEPAPAKAPEPAPAKAPEPAPAQAAQPPLRPGPPGGGPPEAVASRTAARGDEPARPGAAAAVEAGATRGESDSLVAAGIAVEGAARAALEPLGATVLRDDAPGEGAAGAAVADAPAPVSAAAAEGERASAGARGSAEGPPTAPPVGAVGTAPLAKGTARPGVARAIHCVWIRIGGYAFCGPDSEQPGYAASISLQRLAAQLARGNRAEPISEEAQKDPTLALLAADREFIVRAESNYLLPVAARYVEALRRGPEGFDSPRGRVNLALVYYGLGFAPELASEAASTSNPAAPVASALLGDVLREDGDFARASAAYAKAAAAGGLGACLAGRGLAGLALATGDVERARSGLASLGGLCPSAIVKDPATELLRAQLLLAGGDGKGAMAALEPLQRYLAKRERGPLVETIGRAALASGEPDVARRAFDLLATGQFGPRLARQGRIELAHLDADDGDVDEGLRRLSALPLDQRVAARRDLMLEVSRGALAKGDEIQALALIHDENLDPATLPTETQVRLAQGYRSMGLPEEGQRLLDHLVQHGRKPLPAAVWEEVGANALARGDTAAALAAADALRVAEGQSGAAGLKLRARALLAQGDAAQAVAIAAGPLEAASPAAARELRLEIAPALVASDPKAAAALLSAALHAPGLPPLEGARKAEALAALAGAAEKAGDDPLALASYQQLLADFPSEATAIGAPFRISILTARMHGGAAAAAAYDEAAKKSDALTKRIATAARNYDALIKRPEPAQEAK